MLSVLLVDDHRLVRECLSFHLSRFPYIESVLEAADADAALKIVAEHHPDVVVMDTDMPGRSVFDAAQAMRAIDSSCKIAFVGGRDCDAYLADAIRVQASGYILKGDSVADLIRAIMKVAQGGCYFSKSISSRLITDKDGGVCLAQPHKNAIAPLTQRERELLTHLSRGMSLKAAAAVMHISYKTGDNHKTNLMRKLDIHNQVELARFAIRQGLVTPD